MPKNPKWLAFTLVDIKFARGSTQVSFSSLGHPARVNASLVVYFKFSIAGRVLVFNGFLITCVHLQVNLRVRLASQRKSVRKFNLRLLAST